MAQQQQAGQAAAPLGQDSLGRARGWNLPCTAHASGKSAGKWAPAYPGAGAGGRDTLLLGKHGCSGLPRLIPVPYRLEARDSFWQSWELPGVRPRVTEKDTWESPQTLPGTWPFWALSEAEPRWYGGEVWGVFRRACLLALPVLSFFSTSPGTWGGWAAGW